MTPPLTTAAQVQALMERLEKVYTIIRAGMGRHYTGCNCWGCEALAALTAPGTPAEPNVKCGLKWYPTGQRMPVSCWLPDGHEGGHESATGYEIAAEPVETARWVCNQCGKLHATPHEDGCPDFAPPPAEAAPSPGDLDALVREWQELERPRKVWLGDERIHNVRARLLAYPVADRPTPGPMPEIEAGDVIQFAYAEDAPSFQRITHPAALEDWNSKLRDRVQAIHRIIWRRA